MMKGDKITVALPKWLARKLALGTSEIQGVVETETSKAVLVAGYASTRESEYCHNCGREITHPVSKLVGYGPDCSEHLGIPRPEKLTAEMIAAVRDSVQKRTAFKQWLPKSQCQFKVELDESREVTGVSSDAPGTWSADEF